MALVILFEQGTLTFQQKRMNSIGFAKGDLAKLSCLIVVNLIQAYLQRALDLPNVWDNRTSRQREQNVLYVFMQKKFLIETNINIVY